MILVTVGMQLGFDRLIRTMDAIAPSLDLPVVAQTGVSEFRPKNMEAHVRIAPDEFEALVSRSRVIISHAGIGSVLTAQRFKKPIVLLPRRASLGEHRNDHQLATARQLQSRSGILVAMDEIQLAAQIAEALAVETVIATQSESAAKLLSAVASFIQTGQL